MTAKVRNNETTVYGKYGKLRVEGAHLVDESGNPVQLKGVSTHNMNSFPQFVNNDAIEFMADNWGMEIFRLAMYTDSADGDVGYTSGDDAHRAELETMILESVKKCAEIGIYAMIDWHILFDYNPLMHKDEAIAFFAKMSEALKDYDNVIYEICNEPNQLCDWNQLLELTVNPDGSKKGEDVCTWEQIKTYANEVIPVIRKNVPDAVIVCGTPIWSQRVDEAADSPLEFDNIMYAAHFYASTHKQGLRDTITYAMSKGAAIYVTEYGITDASGDGEIDYAETDIWMDFLKKNSISYSIWNLANKDEASSMIKPECSKITGWTDDDLSESGRWFAHHNS
jgi:endoglucanase